jgi:hypothetical protein
MIFLHAPEASVVPSGDHATLFNAKGALRVRRDVPLAVSHRIIVLSLDAEANIVPSGDQATPYTPFV